MSGRWSIALVRSWRSRQIDQALRAQARTLEITAESEQDRISAVFRDGMMNVKNRSCNASHDGRIEDHGCIRDLRSRNPRPVLVERYRTLARASIAKHGGRYVVRGGAVEPVEGAWMPEHIVIVEFPTMEKAREWYRSPDYAEALAVRQTALDRRLIFVEGVPAG
jgi:uncharacterized protein (DUF1330 family)